MRAEKFPLRADHIPRTGNPGGAKVIQPEDRLIAHLIDLRDEESLITLDLRRRAHESDRRETVLGARRRAQLTEAER